MKELMKYWPRNLAYPERIIVRDFSYLIYKLNELNFRKKKLYYSLYNCNEEGRFNHPYIDKLGFDSDAHTVDVALKFHSFCSQHNYKHCIIYSTRGFWLYLFTQNFEGLKNPKKALENAQRFICKEAGLSIYKKKCRNCGTIFEEGESKSCCDSQHLYIDSKINDVDFSCIGDIARVARLPFSYDIKRQCYCIPVCEEDLKKGISYIEEQAKKMRYVFTYYGDKYLDMSIFDDEIESNEHISIPEYKGDYKFENKHISQFLPCVQAALLRAANNEAGVNYKIRWYILIYLRDIGMSKSIAQRIVKPFFEKKWVETYDMNAYEHAIKFRFFDYVWDRRDDFFPRCEKAFLEGFCVGKCKFYNKVYEVN